MTINENIRALRLKNRLSQEKLGELLGVSGQAVSKWEQTLTSPDISLLPMLAEVFGVTIDALFEGVQVRKFPGYQGKKASYLLHTRMKAVQKKISERPLTVMGRSFLAAVQPQRTICVTECCTE